MTPPLRCENLRAGYQDVVVLQDLSFELPAGRITTIIGPNGAGKSTLLRTIYGLTHISQGSIVYEGKDITRLTPLDRLARGIVMIPQGRANFPAMTVYENLLMATYTRHDKSVRQDLEAVMARFPFLRLKRRLLAGNLSGGQQQIMDMAMGLLLRPRLLLVDEPSMGLAPNMVDEVFHAIVDIAGDGMTTLIVEQNAAKALEISDWALVLDLGQKRFEGPAVDIAANPQVRQLYLGQGP